MGNRLWKDKTVDELREEWHALLAKRESALNRSDGNAYEDYTKLSEAMDAIELEIGRRKVPLVDAKD